ncbi:barstar family protein [Massilia sp. H6]|uniref:barstar family protein n=1 Tax=Massilia sp. H6 TaxID=2970464 RepID=UPI00216776FE|nr:barstar family protein [Massilia sp. H6]UVW28451.1 barstar family protein [Massilia sp. H6]
MATAELNGAAIVDEASFHLESRRAFGFPDSYADSIDAWVDCLSYLRDDENMTKFTIKPGEVLEIVIVDAGKMKLAVPDLLEEIAFCVGGINERYQDYGDEPALELVLR